MGNEPEPLPGPPATIQSESGDECHLPVAISQDKQVMCCYVHYKEAAVETHMYIHKN